VESDAESPMLNRDETAVCGLTSSKLFNFSPECRGLKVN
jgi:hypothetical protein